MLAAVNAERFPDGQEVTLEAIFGNSITFDKFGNVTGARAMMQVRVSVHVYKGSWIGRPVTHGHARTPMTDRRQNLRLRYNATNFII